MTSQKVGYFVGSLAKGSINRTLSKALLRVAPANMTGRAVPEVRTPSP
jgi:chromate reductase